MKFGDLVINENAGDKNPTKTLMYVRGGKMITCLDKNGKEIYEGDVVKCKHSFFKKEMIAEVEYNDFYDDIGDYIIDN